MFKWPWRKAVPFNVVLVRRTSSSKRGIHTCSQVVEGVIKVITDSVSPYTFFVLEDKTKLGIHRDRLLEWHSE